MGGKSTQWAAVKTYWSEIKVPPQLGPLDPLPTSPTCQGMEPTSVVQSSPSGQTMPTNLERGFWVRPQLHPEPLSSGFFEQGATSDKSDALQSCGLRQVRERVREQSDHSDQGP